MNLPPENIFGHTKKLRYILAQLGHVLAENPHARVLDFGCGNGSAVSQFIIATLPDTARYMGVDLHQPSIEHANSSFGRDNAIFTRELPGSGSCDIIVYADVLEHLDNPREVLVDHIGLLKPGGQIVGSIPNGRGPFEIESWFDRKLGISNRIAALSRKLRSIPDEPDTPYNIDSGHLQFYTQSEFLKMLADVGLTVTEFKNGTFFGAMVTERFLRLGGTRLFELNAAIAENLPYWAVSTWLFSAKKPATRFATEGDEKMSLDAREHAQRHQLSPPH